MLTNTTKPTAVQTGPTHCVFRRGTFWCGLPADVIRKVMTRPTLVRVPRSPSVLVGMCHERGEFIPILTLDALLRADSLPEEPLMLVINDREGPWGLLIDEVAGLSVLEPSSAPSSESDADWSSVVTGWATFRREVVRIIDSVRFRELTERELSSVRPHASAPALVAIPSQS